MIIICTLAIGAATVGGWVLAAFAVRPFKRLAQQTRQIDAGDEDPDIDVRGATEAVEIAEAVKGLVERVWNEQDKTKAALTSARDFASVSAHELRTPLTAMRTNLEVLSTLDLPEDQRKEVVNDVIRTQSRIEATLGALERLAQGELSTADDHVPVDITELLDRAAHDAMRVYPELDVSLVPAPTVIIVGLPAGLRLAVDNAIANAVKHGGATRVQLSAVSSRAGVEIAIDDDGGGVPEEERKVVFDRFSRGSTASHSGSGLGLALVAQQAELHGGTASLEDESARRRPSAAASCPARADVRDCRQRVAEQVDDEDQRLARQPVPAACGPVGLLRWDDELAPAADLHPGDAVLPALDQTAQRELDRLVAAQELSNSSPVSYSTPT